MKLKPNRFSREPPLKVDEIEPIGIVKARNSIYIDYSDGTSQSPERAITDNTDSLAYLTYVFIQDTLDFSLLHTLRNMFGTIIVLTNFGEL